MGDTPASLLDVNVLAAAVWPSHQFHQTVHAWFAARPKLLWATCAFTQAAFLRLSSNPKVFRDAVGPLEAWRALSVIARHPQHRYWAECPGIPELTLWSSLTLTGHRQITDAYLLALAHHHRGRLVTLDRSIAELLSTAAERKLWVELIAP